MFMINPIIRNIIYVPCGPWKFNERGKCIQMPKGCAYVTAEVRLEPTPDVVIINVNNFPKTEGTLK